MSSSGNGIGELRGDNLYMDILARMSEGGTGSQYVVEDDYGGYGSLEDQINNTQNERVSEAVYNLVSGWKDMVFWFAMVLLGLIAFFVVIKAVD